MFKAGFISILGKPNVGKSTLMNRIVGERLSIITSKAQTTRHRIRGIVNGDNHQLVFSDTPGIIDAAYKLHEGMMNFVSNSIQDADAVLYLTELGAEKALKREEEESLNFKIIQKLNKLKVPVFLVINKIDKVEQSELEEVIKVWEELMPTALIRPVSALKGAFVKELFEELKEKMPESPAYFPEDELTDLPLRFFISEIIREKIFLNYKKEVPYSTEVEIEEFKDEPEIVRIRAVIYVARKSQKGIIIGHQGKMLKKVGTEARISIQDFLQKKVFLETYVKVEENWRNTDKGLKRFGYLN